MADADAGTVAVELVGAFRIVATFAPGPGDEPVFELTLTDDVTAETFTVTSADVELGDGDGFADLGVASWVEDPTDGPVITGRADAADLLADIVRLASNLSDEVHELEDAEALSREVRVNRIEVVLADGLPVSVDATLAFDGIPPALAAALGPYAMASLSWRVSFEPQRA